MKQLKVAERHLNLARKYCQEILVDINIKVRLENEG